MTSKQWKQTFASRLRSAIACSGMDKKYVAHQAGLSPASISQYLSGSQVPSVSAAVSLAKVLKVDLDYLVNFEENSKD